MKSKWVLALLGVVGVAMATGNALATSPPAPTTTQVSKGTFDPIGVRIPRQIRMKTNGPSDVYVVQNTFAPGATTGWHTHPGPSLITVTSGTVTAYEGDDPACTPTAYTPGEGFVDPGGGHVHLLRNETSAPAQTVAVQIVPKDAPRKIDAPPPGTCPF